MRILSLFNVPVLVAALALAGAPDVSAQSNLSSSDMIKMLKLGGPTRGIRPSAGAPADPAPYPVASAPHASASHTSTSRASASVTPRAPLAQSNAPSVNLTVQFPTNSAELTPAAIATLSELGRALTDPSLSGNRFRIEGHTDTAGSADINKSLSERRAATVVEFLATRFGVDRTRLQPIGMGAEGLLVQTPPNTAEVRNRRVLVVNVGT